MKEEKSGNKDIKNNTKWMVLLTQWEYLTEVFKLTISLESKKHHDLTNILNLTWLSKVTWIVVPMAWPIH